MIRGEHRFLEDSDNCFCLGEFTARKKWDFSETNDKILSFKMKPSIRLQNQYRYVHKGRAIEFWATKLRQAMPADDAQKFVWVPVPGSCPKGDSDYDDRLIRLLRHAYGQQLRIWEALSQPDSRIASHDAVERPNPNDLIAAWSVNCQSMPAPADDLIVFDDVMTRGASFKAAQTLVLRCHPTATVSGVFLARTVHDNGPSFDFSLFDE